MTEKNTAKIIDVPVDQIDLDPENHSRGCSCDDIDAIALSIESEDIINPINVRHEEDRFILVAGYRRLAAVKKIGRKTIPVTITDKDPHMVSLTENIVRRDLTVMQKAENIERVLKDVGSNTKLAKKLGMSDQSISDYKRIASLPLELRDMVRDNDKCTVRRLRDIALIKDSSEQRNQFDAYLKSLGKDPDTGSSIVTDPDSVTEIAPDAQGQVSPVTEGQGEGATTNDKNKQPEDEKPDYVAIELNKIERFQQSFAKRTHKWTPEDKQKVYKAGLDLIQHIQSELDKIAKETGFVSHIKPIETSESVSDNTSVSGAPN